MMHSIS